VIWQILNLVRPIRGGLPVSSRLAVSAGLMPMLRRYLSNRLMDLLATRRDIGMERGTSSSGPPGLDSDQMLKAVSVQQALSTGGRRTVGIASDGHA
jgi:recombinational DNA repair ATPase RecF